MIQRTPWYNIDENNRGDSVSSIDWDGVDLFSMNDLIDEFELKEDGMGYIVVQSEIEQNRPIEDYIIWTCAWLTSIVGTICHFFWVNSTELIPLILISIPVAIALFIIGGIIGIFMAFGFNVIKDNFDKIKCKKKQKEQDFQDWIKRCRRD